MRVVIVGAGEVGFSTARMLSEEGHNVVVVERSDTLVERASSQLDALVVSGNGASPRTLEDLGIKKSQLLVACTDSDEVNIIACLAAKSYGVQRTVARIRNSDYYDAGGQLSQEVLGIDFVIHPERTAAAEIREGFLIPGAVNADSFAEGRIEAVEVVLQEDSPAVGRAVKDVHLPDRSLIIGVVRKGNALVPRGDTVLAAKDHVFLVAERREVFRSVGALSTDTSPVKEVMIFGGGRIGLRLAESLERDGIYVKVVEKSAERAHFVASRLRKGLVLHDEGISRDFLLQERVDRVDAFVAAAGDDRANLLAAMYAGQLGARQTIAIISRPEFAPLSDALGVDVAVSPRLLTAGAILRFVRRGDVVAVTLLESGAQMIELRVSEDCPVSHGPLSKVRFPKGAIVGAIRRGEEVIIPTGADTLEPGDDVVVFTVESSVDEVERLFAP